MAYSLVIGGAGFIGVNLADSLLKEGKDVAVLDNFSRNGTEQNLAWLKGRHGNVKVIRADIREHGRKLEDAVKNADEIYHMAAQVAVTTSVENPREDFGINALGTLNVLEAMREAGSEAPLVFASTNKVYGKMERAEVEEKGKRYEYKALPNGVSEEMPVDFYSPYGCSKGCADQYVRDYARIYGLNTVVMRQSCIYGERQFGIEDQGWVAWFAIAAVLGKKLTIYGNGKQARDVLHVSDLINSFTLAVKKIKKTSGKIYNIGGGPKNTLSLLEYLEMLGEMLGKKIEYGFGDWRPGDQPLYVSDIRKAKNELGWEPKIRAKEGAGSLVEWVKRNSGEIESVVFP
ncbi:MAG: GDP-mannose 4,6-dehydratase [Candidatus Diapherotrites archaeon]